MRRGRSQTQRRPGGGQEIGPVDRAATALFIVQLWALIAIDNTPTRTGKPTIYSRITRSSYYNESIWQTC